MTKKMVADMQEQTVSKSEFKARALELFRLVESSGRTIVVTDHGRPALEVRPYHGEQGAFDRLRGSVLRYEDPMSPVDIDWDASL